MKVARNKSQYQVTVYRDAFFFPAAQGLLRSIYYAKFKFDL